MYNNTIRQSSYEKIVETVMVIKYTNIKNTNNPIALHKKKQQKNKKKQKNNNKQTNKRHMTLEIQTKQITKMWQDYTG